MGNTNLINGVIVLKAAKDKAGQATLIYQSCQIDTLCVHNNVKIVDGFVTFGGLKDIKKEAVRIFEKKPYKYLLMYSPSLITKNAQEFHAFVAELESNYGIYVKQLRP